MKDKISKDNHKVEVVKAEGVYNEMMKKLEKAFDGLEKKGRRESESDLKKQQINQLVMLRSLKLIKLTIQMRCQKLSPRMRS